MVLGAKADQRPARRVGMEFYVWINLLEVRAKQIVYSGQKGGSDIEVIDTSQVKTLLLLLRQYCS